MDIHGREQDDVRRPTTRLRSDLQLGDMNQVEPALGQGLSLCIRCYRFSP